MHINQLEQGTKAPTDEMRDALADALGVARHFFALPAAGGIRPEQCHFRKQRTTPVSVVSQVLARGTPARRVRQGAGPRARSAAGIIS